MLLATRAEPFDLIIGLRRLDSRLLKRMKGTRGNIFALQEFLNNVDQFPTIKPNALAALANVNRG